MAQTFEEALDKVGIGTANDVRNKLVDKAPVDEGGLKTGINATYENHEILITMPAYGLYVDTGTGGTITGQVSTVAGETLTISPNPSRKMPITKENDKWVSLLAGWAKRVLGDEKAGFALAKYIQLYGTRPHPFIRPTIYQEAIDLYVENWKRHMVDIDLSTIGDVT